MTAPTDITPVRKRVLEPSDCGLCTHPGDGHDAGVCAAVNVFGQCCCWSYMPAVERDATGVAA